MDHLDSIIAEFRSSPRRRLGLVDKLYLALPDSRAFEILLSAATDPSENEDVRCAAWKVWHNEEPEQEGQRERLLAAAREAAGSDPSDLVRSYAICALSRYAERLDVEAVLLPLMNDRSNAGSVRSAAFQVLSRRGRERREEAFRALLDDCDLGDEVRTYFS